MSDLIERKAKIVNGFRKLGTANGSAPPQADDNRFTTAYELHVATILRDVAKARYDAAKAQAIMEGMLDEDYQPGTHVPYSAGGLSVVAKRNQDSTTLDSTKLKNALTIKLGEADTKKLLDECSKPRKGNLTISVSMD